MILDFFFLYFYFKVVTYAYIIINFIKESCCGNWSFFLKNFLFSLSFLISVLLSTSFFTLLERKKLSAVQNRKGPNRVGWFGLLQPIADGLKLMFKEVIIPKNSNFFTFQLSPVLAFFCGVVVWSFMPLGDMQTVFSDLNLSLLYVFLFSVFHIYSIMIAGWSSNSRYALLGSLRSSAQLIAYDISFGVIILNYILITKGVNLINIYMFQHYFGPLSMYFFCIFLLFLICVLAETSRHPFDLPEAEAELVSGYNVEYSAMSFALFFLGEYSAILFMSYLCVVLFLNLSGLFFFFFLLIIFFFILVRAIIPRYRYDQLMQIGWKVILPLALSFLIWNFLLFYFFDGFIASNNMILGIKLIQ